eukprot:6714460-Prymnesium_polylepis.1
MVERAMGSRLPSGAKQITCCSPVWEQCASRQQRAHSPWSVSRQCVAMLTWRPRETKMRACSMVPVRNGTTRFTCTVHSCQFDSPGQIACTGGRVSGAAGKP